MVPINVVEVTGRLVRDPDLRFVGQGFAICTLNVAVDNGFSKWDPDQKKSLVESGFYRIEVVGDYGAMIAEQVKKGTQIYCRGSLTQWVKKAQNGEGESERKTSIRADLLVPLTGEMVGQQFQPPAEPVTDESQAEGWRDEKF